MPIHSVSLITFPRKTLRHGSSLSSESSADIKTRQLIERHPECLKFASCSNKKETKVTDSTSDAFFILRHRFSSRNYVNSISKSFQPVLDRSWPDWGIVKLKFKATDKYDGQVRPWYTRPLHIRISHPEIPLSFHLFFSSFSPTTNVQRKSNPVSLAGKCRNASDTQNIWTSSREFSLRSRIRETIVWSITAGPRSSGSFNPLVCSPALSNRFQEGGFTHERASDLNGEPVYKFVCPSRCTVPPSGQSKLFLRGFHVSRGNSSCFFYEENRPLYREVWFAFVRRREMLKIGVVIPGEFLVRLF